MMGCKSGPLACQQQQVQMESSTASLEGVALAKPEPLSTLERLALATGGTEKSWYRCIFPFGIISLVIGLSSVAVTFYFNNLPMAKAVSVVLLGVGLMVTTFACCRVHNRKKRKRKEGGSFSLEQCAL
ncbi:transmembrane protein 100-like [Acipenser ruthenus]|uniref:transmembrane protein 100-like n=1 Tax=Acipenser ruthenus TaxID=7906 RepID=UPI001560B548|nr:transmembrane protein 100-like [Acipenser ruthenus]